MLASLAQFMVFTATAVVSVLLEFRQQGSEKQGSGWTSVPARPIGCVYRPRLSFKWAVWMTQICSESQAASSWIAELLPKQSVMADTFQIVNLWLTDQLKDASVQLQHLNEQLNTGAKLLVYSKLSIDHSDVMQRI